jgi:hypothetical protein
MACRKTKGRVTPAHRGGSTNEHPSESEAYRCAMGRANALWVLRALRGARSHRTRLIDAVVSTASNRAAAVQPPGFVPDASAAARQRSSVATDTPISRDTTARSALSGGNSLAAALSLNACPYRATCHFLSPPNMVLSGRQLVWHWGPGQAAQC